MPPVYDELTAIVVAAARKVLERELREYDALRRYRARKGYHKQYDFAVPDGLTLYLKRQRYYGLCNNCGWIDTESHSTPRLAVTAAAVHTCNTPPTP
jgi:hypothetical protein